jgi:hypothetical protein
MDDCLMTTNDSSNVPGDDDTPPSKLGDADLFAKLKEWVKKDWTSSSEWRRKAEEWYSFEAGDQWEQSVKDTLKNQRRPFMTFNRVSSTVNAICGMEVNNRMETNYVPRTNDDTGVNDMMTEAARWVDDECDFEDEKSTVFRDLTICGMGWAETRMDYEVDKDGLIIIERVNPMEMCWDANASKANLSDARCMARVKEISLDTARAMFPDVDDSDLNADWLQRNDREGDIVDRELARWYDSGVESSKPTKCTIVEIQWYETVEMQVVVDPTTGQSTEMSMGDFSKLNKRATQAGIQLQSAKRKKRVYYRAFLGAVILDEGEGKDRLKSPCDCDYTWKCATAYYDQKKRYWYGVVQQMIDPQRWANAFLSSSLYQIMSSGKGIMAERDAFDNVQKAEEDWAQADKITWMKPGAIAGGKVLPKPIAQIHPQLNELMQMSLNAVREVPGINVEILGQANRDQPASLEYQRRQSVMAILAPLFNGLRRFSKGQGRLTLYFIRTYISDGRMIRISGQQNAQYVPLAKLPDTVEYDVIVDESASSPNQKEQTWAFLQSLLPMITQSVQMSLPLWGEVLKASPLPMATVNNFLNVAEQQAQQPPPPNPDMIRASNDIEKTKLDAKKIDAEIALKQRELDIKAREQELDGQRMDHEVGLATMQQHHDRKIRAMDNQAATDQSFMSSSEDGSSGLTQSLSAIPQIMAAMQQQNAQTQQLLAALLQQNQQAQMQQQASSAELARALMAPKEIYTDPATGMPKGIAPVRSIQ